MQTIDSLPQHRTEKQGSREIVTYPILLTEERAEGRFVQYLLAYTGNNSAMTVLFHVPSIGKIDGGYVGDKPSSRAMRQWFGRWYAMRSSSATEWFEFHDTVAEQSYQTTKARIKRNAELRNTVDPLTVPRHARIQGLIEQGIRSRREKFAALKVKFVKQVITIALPETSKAKRTVDAMTYRGLAIHHGIDRLDSNGDTRYSKDWNITHIGTGLRISCCDTRDEAKFQTWRVAELVDWTRDGKVISQDRKAGRIALSIQQTSHVGR